MLTQDQCYSLLSSLVCKGNIPAVLDSVRSNLPDWLEESTKFLNQYQKHCDPKQFKFTQGYVDVAAYKRAYLEYSIQREEA